MKKILILPIFFLSLVFGQTNFYDLNTIQDIHVTFTQTNWDYMLDTAKNGSEGYIVASQCIINGVAFDSIGIKYKGNSTYNANQVKNPLHIQLDYVKGKQDYQGYTDVKLSNIAKDPSMVREVLSYKILRNYMHAPESNFAKVYINGTYMGVYTNVEAINNKFVGDHFYSSDKPFFKCNPIGGAGPGSSSLPTLVLGSLTDSTTYYAAYEMESDYGWKQLIHLMDTLKNQTTNVEKILDVDRALWMIAFNDVLVNLDSYTGSFAQNYYLYQDDNNRFNSIIWDLNMCFGGFTMLPTSNLDSAGMRNLSLTTQATNNSRPLIKYLLSVPQYKKMYVAHAKTIVNEMFASNLFFTDGQAMQALINADVQADVNKFYSYTNFLKNLTAAVTGTGGGPGGGSIQGVKNLMLGRTQYLNSTTEFQYVAPTISNISASNTTPSLHDTVWITADISNATTIYLGSRQLHYKNFSKTTMYDDGAHHDGAAGDGKYGAAFAMDYPTVEYYLYAENTNAGIFSPQRAEHEFYSLTAIIPQLAPKTLVINEILASNVADATDASGQHADWIELYNNTAQNQYLFGLYLSDDSTQLQKWALPESAMIPANGYLIIWADNDILETGLHANFKLSSGGEKVILSYADGTILDSISFGAQTADISFGRYPNGLGSFGFMPTTFNAMNTTNVGIDNEVVAATNIAIFPNPANENLNIESRNPFQKIEVWNSLGQKMTSVEISRSEEYQLSLRDYPAGMYFLKLDDSSEAVKFMVK